MADNRMMVRADARAIGAVTALNTTHRRKPRLNRALSDTLVTRGDGTQYWIARRQRNASKRTTRTTVVAALPTRTMSANLPNAAGNITYD